MANQPIKTMTLEQCFNLSNQILKRIEQIKREQLKSHFFELREHRPLFIKLFSDEARLEYKELINELESVNTIRNQHLKVLNQRRLQKEEKFKALTRRIQIYLLTNGYFLIDSSPIERNIKAKAIAKLPTEQRIAHINKISQDLGLPNPYWNK